MAILIIEDNPEIHTVISEKLRQEKFQFESAYSGTEAKLRCEQQDYDLLLLDLMLPGLSGEEFLRWYRIKSMSPVIVISALEDIDEKIRLLEIGANDYMVKPFDLDELIARIRVQLRSEKLPAKKRCHGELCLDEEARQILWQKQGLQLTRQEYEILALLLRYPRKVFTRQELMEGAWEDYFESDDQSLSVHISNIRKKLRHYSHEEIIETVWGVGFRLKQL